MLRAQVAALQAVLAAERAQVSAAATTQPAQMPAPAQPVAQPADARDMKREANVLLSKIRNSTSMKSLLEALASNTPAKRLLRTPLKKFINTACANIMMWLGEASQRSPMISTAEVFRGLQATCNELMKFENELAKGNPVTSKEFNNVVRILRSKPLELEVPPAASDASTDDVPDAAATTEEEDSGVPTEDEDEDEDEEGGSAALTVDVERNQPPVAADAPEKVKEAFALIMGCASLRKMLRFDLAPFLLRLHTHLTNGIAACTAMQYGVIDSSETAKMFGGGKTQARKTPLKLCAFILCRMMGVATVLLTTNVSGREDLFSKFIELLGDIAVPALPATIPSGSNDSSYRYYRVKERDEQGRQTTKIKLEKAPPAGATALAEGVIGISVSRPAKVCRSGRVCSSVKARASLSTTPRLPSTRRGG